MKLLFRRGIVAPAEENLTSFYWCHAKMANANEKTGEEQA